MRERLTSRSGMLLTAIQHPASWVFAAIYALSALTLIITGNTIPLAVELGLALVLALLVVITGALTAPEPHSVPSGEENGTTPQRAWVQLGVLAVIVIFTLYAGMVLNGAAPHIPGLFELVRGVYRLSTLILNPILYVVVPGILLLLLGARPDALGLARGQRPWLVAAQWSVLPLVGIAISLAVGSLSLPGLLGLLVGNTLRNGPMEEFLWRGAVLTRLRLSLGTAWSAVLSSLAFGIWHIGTNLHAFGGQLAPAVAYCFVSQATIGLAFALVFVRTRNLLASSVAHVLLNTTSTLLG